MKKILDELFGILIAVLWGLLIVFCIRGGIK